MSDDFRQDIDGPFKPVDFDRAIATHDSLFGNLHDIFVSGSPTRTDAAIIVEGKTADDNLCKVSVNKDSN